MAERILVVDDESGPREGLRRLLEAWGYDTATAASADEALEQIERERPSAVITDLVMPGLDALEFVRRVHLEHAIPVVVFSGQGTIEAAVEAIKLGAVDFLEKPVEPSKLKILLQRFASTRELLADNRRLRAELRERGALGKLRGASEKMRAVYRQIEQVAPSTLSVLIVGESGTGKEIVAQTLHDLSPRRKAEFVAINCAAIPGSLLESEIFGHERGAFTGAIQRKIGCFEMAHRGTLFLDEISEMDELLQAKLLRVLQEQKFRRVGGREIIESDVRVIAATNREPMRAIAEGKLREDLYYRLNVFAIELPTLRQRKEDLSLLMQAFLAEFNDRNKKNVSAVDPAAMRIFEQYNWPGNVRELRNVIERAVILAQGEFVEAKHLPPLVTESPDVVKPVIELEPGTTVEEAERRLILMTLEHTRDNKTRAAEILGISLKTLHNKLNKLRGRIPGRKTEEAVP